MTKLDEDKNPYNVIIFDRCLIANVCVCVYLCVLILINKTKQYTVTYYKYRTYCHKSFHKRISKIKESCIYMD